ALADAYRLTLAGFLGDLRKSQVSVVNKHGVPVTQRTTAMETIKQLNILDIRRRQDEIRSFAALPGRSSPPAPH
ncbi:MAG TPA: hypothetical protein VL970_10590, partial [Candidatus Acidoferrales bacterium]|nr:hypothetical protein [Candidatus Acidoferrales bacterium]